VPARSGTGRIWVGVFLGSSRGARSESGAGKVSGAQEVVYSGTGFSLRGEKGRFVLPPAFRKSVAESSDGKILCLAKHERWNCLTGFGLSRKADLETQIAQEQETAIRTGRDFDPDLRRMQLFGFSEVPFDASGRFVMPDHLAELGCLDGGVYFHGAGRFFFLWNPDELFRMGAGHEGAQASCRSLLAREGKGGKG